jgi:hypothetical protein
MTYRPVFKNRDRPYGCGPKNKKMYATRAIALMYANRVAKIESVPKLRAYKCDICHTWHLTKQLIPYTTTSRST